MAVVIYNCDPPQLCRTPGLQFTNEWKSAAELEHLISAGLNATLALAFHCLASPLSLYDKGMVSCNLQMKIGKVTKLYLPLQLLTRWPSHCWGSHVAICSVGY